MENKEKKEFEDSVPVEQSEGFDKNVKMPVEVHATEKAKKKAEKISAKEKPAEPDTDKSDTEIEEKKKEKEERKEKEMEENKELNTTEETAEMEAAAVTEDAFTRLEKKHAEELRRLQERHEIEKELLRKREEKKKKEQEELSVLLRKLADRAENGDADICEAVNELRKKQYKVPEVSEIGAREAERLLGLLADGCLNVKNGLNKKMEEKKNREQVKKEIEKLAGNAKSVCVKYRSDGKMAKVSIKTKNSEGKVEEQEFELPDDDCYINPLCALPLPRELGDMSFPFGGFF